MNTIINTDLNRDVNSASSGSERPASAGVRLMASVSILALTLGTLGNVTFMDGLPHTARALAALPGGAHGQEEQLFADLTPIADAALETQRGGFKMGNFDISVGVSVSSTIDGFMTVTSNFSVLSPGEITGSTQTIPSIPSVPDIDVPAVEIPDVDIPDVPKVAIPDVDVPDVDIPDVPKVAIPAVDVPDVDIPDVPKVAIPAAPATTNSDTNGAASTNLAIDTAKTVFDAVEMTGSANQSVDPGSDTAIAIGKITEIAGTVRSEIDKAQDTIARQKAAVPANTHQAKTPDSGTLTAMAPDPAGKAASPLANPSGKAAVVVSGPNTNGTSSNTTPAEVIASAMGDAAQIIHRSTNGHLSVIQNTVDGMSIRHSVAVNVTVENFQQVQHLTKVQNHMASLARHVGVYSLRR